jgi:Protein of unknown function (DUF1549)/Planctomycete cytochrome C
MHRASARHWLPSYLLLTLVGLGARSSLGQNSGVEYFETRIRPILVAKCQPCHSAALRTAGLDLSSAEGFQKGGDRGMLVQGSDPSESRLLQPIGYEGQIKMPPTGRLKSEEIAAIRQWVQMGSPWPSDKAVVTNVMAADSLPDLTELPKFWSFQPVRKAVRPPVSDPNWVKTPIDAFVLAKLEEKKLKPAPPADKVTLLRRAAFDLTGLPPTEKEIATFWPTDRTTPSRG